MPGVLKKAAFVLGALLIVAAAAFTWNESRMEIKFLCGNFTPGVTRDSVIRQLETGNFLRYRTVATAEDASSGEHITVSSLVTLGIYRCDIALDANGFVTEAGYKH